MACCHCLMVYGHRRWLPLRQRIGCCSPSADDLRQPGMRVPLTRCLPHVSLLTCTLVPVPLHEY